MRRWWRPVPIAYQPSAFDLDLALKVEAAAYLGYAVWKIDPQHSPVGRASFGYYRVPFSLLS